MSSEKQIAEICAITSNACCIGCEETPFVPESSGICDYLDCRSCKEARLLLNAGFRKQEWISVEERLPDNHRYVLVACEGLTIGGYAQIAIGSYGGGLWSIADADGTGYLTKYMRCVVTHWMPLPSLPEKEKNDD